MYTLIPSLTTLYNTSNVAHYPVITICISLIIVIVNITITTFISQLIPSSVRSILLSYTHRYSYTIKIDSSNVFAWSALIVTDRIYVATGQTTLLA